MACLSYESLTGSELYVYELSRKLKELGCEVTIMSPKIGSPLLNLTRMQGIEVIQPQATKGMSFDIIHCQHVPVVEMLCRVFPDTPKVCTIHSEIISLEKPVLHQSIKKYISIRPSITRVLRELSVKGTDIAEICNPINEERFSREGTEKRPYALFVGTLDYLRKETVYDLMHDTKTKQIKLILIGSDIAGYAHDLKKNDHVIHQNPYFNIETHVKKCLYTAGIMLGRTTIEGWMCGKAGWIYNVNDAGKILAKNYVEPPLDLEKYYSSKVAQQVFDLYESVLTIAPEINN